jgi:hypothetical protein
LFFVLELDICGNEKEALYIVYSEEESTGHVMESLDKSIHDGATVREYEIELLEEKGMFELVNKRGEKMNPMTRFKGRDMS